MRHQATASVDLPSWDRKGATFCLMEAPTIRDLKFIPTEFRPLDYDGEWLISGGCGVFVVAMKEVFPEGKIAVAWYSDHGRRAIAHAVFYDPETGKAWDGCGSWDQAWVAISGHNGIIEQEMDADASVLAAHMEIPYNPEAPFADDRIMDAWQFAERHFLPEYHAALQAEYGDSDEDDF